MQGGSVGPQQDGQADRRRHDERRHVSERHDGGGCDHERRPHQDDGGVDRHPLTPPGVDEADHAQSHYPHPGSRARRCLHGLHGGTRHRTHGPRQKRAVDDAGTGVGADQLITVGRVIRDHGDETGLTIGAHWVGVEAPQIGGMDEEAGENGRGHTTRARPHAERNWPRCASR